jgi:hypothetical protein
MIKLRDLIYEYVDTYNSIPRLLYHATYKQKLRSIKKYGIVPGGKGKRNFPEVERGVYLGYTPEYAGSMVEASENDDIPEEWFDEIVILTIDTSKLNLSKLDHDPNVLPQEDEYNNDTPSDENVYSYIYRDNIPFSSVINISKYN